MVRTTNILLLLVSLDDTRNEVTRGEANVVAEIIYFYPISLRSIPSSNQVPLAVTVCIISLLHSSSQQPDSKWYKWGPRGVLVVKQCPPHTRAEFYKND